MKSLFLVLIVFSAACVTGEVTGDSNVEYIDCSQCDDNNPCTIDSCSNEGCGHENVVCQESEKLCPDGSLVTCSNACVDGACSTCEPQCLECVSDITCSEWTECTNGQQSRTCSDANSCVDNETETQECAVPEIVPVGEQIMEIEKKFDSIQEKLGEITQSDVTFLEIMYDPAGTEREEEYIVLTGSGDVSGWTISDNIGPWKLPEGTVIDGNLIVARNGEAFASIHGCSAHVSGLTRGLNNNGDQLSLRDTSGTERDFVAWEGGASGAYPEWTISTSEGNVLRKNADWTEAAPSPCS